MIQYFYMEYVCPSHQKGGVIMGANRHNSSNGHVHGRSPGFLDSVRTPR